jgi:hypothetical protein
LTSIGDGVLTNTAAEILIEEGNPENSPTVADDGRAEAEVDFNK